MRAEGMSYLSIAKALGLKEGDVRRLLTATDRALANAVNVHWG